MAKLGRKDVEMLNSDFSDDGQERKKRSKRKRLKKVEGDIDLGDEKEERGVVYLSHIPHGFYEPQMKHFFGQFGNVTRYKLWRSKKSGKSRGYAYVEFEYADVAKIVADTMNNYLMYQKLLKCKFIPNKDLVPKAFSQCHRKFVKPYHRELSAKRHNSLLTGSESRILKNQKRLVQVEGRRKKKMAALGIEYNPTGYAEEWEDIKKAKAVVNEKRRLEALRLKEIEMRKEAALKRAKQKAHLLSKKRRIGKRLRRREEREKNAAAEKPEESKMETPKQVTPKYPKRKSQDAVSGDADQQPLKKKGRTSTLSTPSQKFASPAPNEEVKEASPAVTRSRRSGRRSLKSDDAASTSPDKEPSSKNPKPKTPSSKMPKIIKEDSSTPKRVKDASPSHPVSKPSAENQKDSPDPKIVKKTPKSTRGGKTPKKEFSLDSETGSDSESGKPKVMEFTGIKRQISKTPEVRVELKTPKASLTIVKTPKTASKGSSKKTSQTEEHEGSLMTPKAPTSSKKGASAKKSAKKVKEISIQEDKLLLF